MKYHPHRPTGGYLASKQVCERYDIVLRTLNRWCTDPAMEFPKPLVINNRNYFLEADLITWERKRATAAA
jgi:hypothetical protein